MSVTLAATKVEFRIARRNRSSLSTCRKFFSVGSAGMYLTGVSNNRSSGVIADRSAQ